MPFQNEQIKIINDALRVGALGDERFAGARWIDSIAKLAVENDDENADRTFPFYFNENHSPETVDINDTYSLTIYHRHLSSTFEQNENRFGDSSKRINENASMTMVVFGNSERLNINAEQLQSLFILAMPTNIKKSLLSGIRIDAMNVTLNTVQNNSLTVFGDEFTGVDYAISPSDILFKIDYQIATQYRRDCFDLCDCEFAR